MVLKNKLMIVEAELNENKESHIQKTENVVVSRIKENPREFYRYACSKTRNRTTS